MDGGSTDGTLNVLQEYPHLKVYSESDCVNSEYPSFSIPTPQYSQFFHEPQSPF